MARPKGQPVIPLTEFERDYIRYGKWRGWSDAKIGQDLGRSKQGINTARKRMERDGTINQLYLPGLEPRPEASGDGK